MGIIAMPKMGDTMAEGTIAKWYKKVGDTIKEGEVIAEIETEKAAIEIEAFENGPLTRIIVEEGQTVPVGAPIAEVGGSAAPADAVSNGGGSTAAPPKPEAPATAVSGGGSAPPAPPVPFTAVPPREPEPTSAPIEEPGFIATGRVVASPLARRIALQNSVDLRRIQGTGPGGRIVKEDVEAFVQGMGSRVAPEQAASRQPSAVSPTPAPTPIAPAPSPTEVWVTGKAASRMRQVIARRLTESKQQIPHFYVTTDVNMAPAMALREQLNARGEGFTKLSPNDIVTKAVADALRAFAPMRQAYGGEQVLTTERVNVGVAVSLPEGLIVPVVRDADKKSLNAVALETRALVEKARAGKLLPDDYSGGTFSISNLGMYGVENFSAIVNPPEPGILAVSAIAQVPVVENGQFAIGTRMKVTLSVDHRVIDGVTAAQFLQEVQKRLESPLMLLQ